MKRIYFIFIVFMIAMPAYAKSAHGLVDKGNRHYRKGEYKEALGEYKQALEKKPEAEVVNFDCGTAAYKQGDYAGAKNYFLKALVANDKSLARKAGFNLGNSDFKSALEMEEKDIDGAIKEMSAAVERFEGIVKSGSKDKDAQYNYEAAQKELERLKKKKKEQENNKNNQQQEKKQEQNKQEQKKQEEQQQDSQQQQSEQQKNEQEKKDEQKKEEQKKQEKDAQSGEDRPQSASGDRSEKEELSAKEAASMLAEYREAEPEKLYKEKQPVQGQKEADKDW